MRRVLFWTLATVLALGLAAVAAVVWLGSSAGRETALSLVSGVAARAGVDLRIEGAQGAIGSELTLGRLRADLGTTRIDADGVTLSWQPGALFSGLLSVDRLHVRMLTLELGPGEPPSPTLEAVDLPAEVGLPVAVRIGELGVGELIVRTAAGPDAPEAGEPVRLHDIAAALAWRDEQLSVTDGRLHSPFGALGGLEASVRTRAPYPLQLSARFAGRPADQPVSLELSASGDADRIAWGVQGQAADAEVDAEGVLRPLGPLPAITVQADVKGLDPAVFGAQMPQAALDVAFTADNLRQVGGVSSGDVRPEATSLQGRVRLVNAEPGTLPAGRVPVRSLRTGWALDWTGDPASSRLALGNLEVELSRTDDAPATVTGDAYTTLAPALPFGPWRLPEAVATLRLADLDAGVFAAGVPTRISGEVGLSGRRLSATLDQPARPAATSRVPPALRGRGRLDLKARLDPGTLSLERLQLAVGESAVRAAGEVGVQPPYRSALAGQLHRIRPAAWLGEGWPAGERWGDSELNAGFGLQAEVSEDAVSELTLNIADSRLAGRSLSGLVRGQAHLAGGSELSRLDELRIDVRHGPDRWRVDGALGRQDDVLELDVRLRDLAAFAPAVAGDLSVQGSVRGRFEAATAALTARAGSLRVGDGEGATAVSGLALEASAPLSRGALEQERTKLRVTVNEVNAGGERIRAISAELDGRLGEHRLKLAARARDHALRATLTGGLSLAAGSFEDPRWQGRLSDLRVDGTLGVRQRGASAITAAPAALEADNLDLELARGRLSVARLAFEPPTGQGALTAGWRDLSLEALLAPAAVSLPEGVPDLLLAGRVEVRGSGPADLDGRIALNLAEPAGAEAAGVLGGRNRFEATLTEGTIDGLVELTVPSLAFTRRWTGEELRVDGGLTLTGDLSGPLLEPRLDARLSGRDIEVRQPALGWVLEDGSLVARLEGRELTLERLRLASGEGRMTLTGRATLLDREAPVAPGALPLQGRFQLDADALAVPLGPGQRIVLDGQTRFDSDAQGMALTGELRARSGLIEIASSGAPTLPGDIAIVDESSAGQPAPPAPADGANEVPAGPAPKVRSDLKVNLGDQLRVVGAGVNARLGGELAIRGVLPESPTVNGTVRLIEGSYKAYGQDLAVRRGEVRFDGPIDNPVLDLAAVRPNLPVEVGVTITGNALNPVIELFSSPAMSDAEKLSWLVLGAPLDDASTAAQSLALQQAALTLVGRDDGSISGGGLADKLGLENIGFGYASTTGQQELVTDAGALTGLPGSGQESSSSARDEVVTVSKRLSSKLRVSYEQGVRGVWNLLRLQYEINDRLSLRAQTGSDSAIDLLYFFSFD